MNTLRHLGSAVTTLVGNLCITASMITASLIPVSVARAQVPAQVPSAAPASAAASAQLFPTRSISIVVPYSAGGVTDVIARMFAQKLSDQLGKPVLVDNKPGAGGNIGTDLVARAAPDGYTILMMVDSNTIAPALYNKLNSDPINDFAPITMVAMGSHIIVAHPSFPVNNVKELLEYARKIPGEPYASSGNGTAQHLGMELFKMMGGIILQHVPYKGGGQAIGDVVGGQVKVAILGLAPVLPHIRSGRLKVLAVTGEKRSATLPDAATVAESGLPGFSTLQWFGAVVPAGTPAAVISRLNAEFRIAAQDSVILEKLSAIGMEARMSANPDDLSRFMKDDLLKWPPIVKAAGVKVD